MPAGRPAGRPEISLRKSLSPAQPTPCFEKGPRSLLENGRFLRPHEAYSFFANGPLLRPKSSKGGPLSSRAGLATFFFPDQKNRFFLLWGLLLLCKWTTAETLWGALLLWKWTSILAWKWTIQHIHSSSLCLSHTDTPIQSSIEILYWKNSLNSIENPIQIPL